MSQEPQPPPRMGLEAGEWAATQGSTLEPFPLAPPHLLPREHRDFMQMVPWHFVPSPSLLYKAN